MARNLATINGQVAAHLAGLMESIRRGGRAALKDFGEIAVEEIQARTPVDTGLLRDSYKYSINDYLVTVGTDVYYAPYVEFGTSRNYAQPHFVPGMQAAFSRMGKLAYTRILASEVAYISTLRAYETWDIF